MTRGRDKASTPASKPAAGRKQAGRQPTVSHPKPQGPVNIGKPIGGKKS